MELHFVKYQGTGNDFIIVDNRNKAVNLSAPQVAYLCDRHFGIGADGLMLLELEDGYDFRMIYFNSDGQESSMCGNGGRCITAFAYSLGIIGNQASFIAVDGPHIARMGADGTISLKMADVPAIEYHDDCTVLNTGSPHYVKIVDDVNALNVVEVGRSIRNSKPFSKEGINVNFVQRIPEGIKVRTYERGVEDETLSCGTGVTAAAIASTGAVTGRYNIVIDTPGGQLLVHFEKPTTERADNVYLEGPAARVFEGTISI